MKKIITLIVLLVMFFIGINVTILGSTSQLSSSGLEDSEIYGGYDDKHEDYNCYAFAIERYETNPKYQTEGKMCEPGIFKYGKPMFDKYHTTILELANYVREDLEMMGMTSVDVSPSEPVTIGDNQKLICVRRGDEDYHFMKYIKEEDIWLHKVRNSCIMKFNGSFNVESSWTNEFAKLSSYYDGTGDYGVVYDGGNVEYSGTIYYILYTVPEVITMNCQSSAQTYNDTLEMITWEDEDENIHSVQQEIIREVDINCKRYYTFKIEESTANMEPYFKFVNYKMDLYADIDSDYVSGIDNGYEFTLLLEPGKYYLIIYLSALIPSTTVTTTVSVENLDETPLCTGHNYIADGNLYFEGSLHQIKDNKYEGFFTYFNTVEGLYKFTIEYDKPTNLTSNISTVDIKVKKNNQDIKITSFNENNPTKIKHCVVAFLNENYRYNIELLCNEEQYSNLNLNIEKYNENYLEIDTFNLLELNNNTVNILDDEPLSNNNVFMIDLKQTSKFNLNLIFESSTINDIYLWVAKYTPSNANPIITEIMSELITHNYTEELILEEGLYYICYFNEDDASNISSYLTWLISDSGEEKLVSDPGSSYVCGSQITLLEKDKTSLQKSYGSTQILKGFTRIAYLNQVYIGSCYNQDYYWYSSDDTVASVSMFGTIFGKRAGTVYIMAVNKVDPSKVYVKEFTVYGNSNNEVKEILIEDTFDLDYGTYKLNLTAQNSPYPMIQYYNWTISIISQDNDDFFVDMDGWGVVTANSTGVICLTGNYIYNSNYQIKYILRIIE